MSNLEENNECDEGAVRMQILTARNLLQFRTTEAAGLRMANLNPAHSNWPAGRLAAQEAQQHSFHHSLKLQTHRLHGYFSVPTVESGEC
jgi:hypothetical protein